MGSGRSSHFPNLMWGILDPTLVRSLGLKVKRKGRSNLTVTITKSVTLDIGLSRYLPLFVQQGIICKFVLNVEL